MKLVLLLLIAVLYSVHCELSKEEIHKEWKSFKAKYGKNYAKARSERFRGLSEDNFRKKMFVRQLKKVKAHNEKYQKGLETYKVGLNKFTDMSEEELRPYTHGVTITLTQPKATVEVTSRKSLGLTKRRNIPKSLDWREKGIVTPIKNQKRCGSCWAFSTVGTLESHVKLEKGSSHKVSPSEQQLVDCTTTCNGCHGGLMTAAFDYIRKHGITSNEKYPYTATNRTCRYKQSDSVVKIRGFAVLKKRDEQLMAEMVATKGPVAVAIDTRPPFMSYRSGVYYNPECSPDHLRHAVIVVGYGSENGQDYWIVKNSYGTGWGDNGYIKMARNRKNNCGIASYVSHPIL